jgi:hypothetical protein
MFNLAFILPTPTILVVPYRAISQQLILDSVCTCCTFYSVPLSDATVISRHKAYGKRVCNSTPRSHSLSGTVGPPSRNRVNCSLNPHYAKEQFLADFAHRDKG